MFRNSYLLVSPKLCVSATGIEALWDVLYLHFGGNNRATKGSYCYDLTKMREIACLIKLKARPVALIIKIKTKAFVLQLYCKRLAFENNGLILCAFFCYKESHRLSSKIAEIILCSANR